MTTPSGSDLVMTVYPALFGYIRCQLSLRLVSKAEWMGRGKDLGAFNTGQIAMDRHSCRPVRAATMARVYGQASTKGTWTSDLDLGGRPLGLAHPAFWTCAAHLVSDPRTWSTAAQLYTQHGSGPVARGVLLASSGMGIICNLCQKNPPSTCPSSTATSFGCSIPCWQFMGFPSSDHWW